jgi:hypothetical protein
MREGKSDLSARELYLAYVTDYLDGTVPRDVADEVNKFADGHKDLGKKYQHARGKLQLALQSVYLNEDETLEIRRMISNQQDRLSMDEVRISLIERSEFWANFRRQAGFAVMAFAAVLIAVYVASPKERESFDPLQALAYEALSYESDPNGGLDYPATEPEELREYFNNNPRFNVKPVTFRVHPQGWRLVGASVIDYDVAVIGVVEYKNDALNEHLFHFSYEGSLDDLMNSEEGDVDGFKYRAYASDKVNLIAWQQAEGLVSFLVGHRSAVELAKMAKESL